MNEFDALQAIIATACLVGGVYLTLTSIHRIVTERVTRRCLL